MGLPVHLRGRGGPPAGLPCGSQIPTYLSLGVRSLRDLDHHVTACSEGVRACGGGGGCWACFRSGPISVGGGGGSKRSAPLFPGPHEEPAHGLHPRFVVAEIWADREKGGGGGFGWEPAPPRVPSMVPAEGRPKVFKLKSSWRRRHQSKILAVSLKHWKGRRGGGSREVTPPSSYGVQPFQNITGTPPPPLLQRAQPMPSHRQLQWHL